MRTKPTGGVATVLITLLTFSVPGQAQDHLVSPADVSARLARAAADRRAALTTLDGIVCSPAGRQVAHHFGLDTDKVRARLTQLTDTEAIDLAARARALRVDPAAGDLNGFQITLIVVGGVLLLIAGFLALLYWAGPYD